MNNILFSLTPKAMCAFLYDDYTVRQALEKMEAAHYSALPILNRRGEYRGTITEGDLLDCMDSPIPAVTIDMLKSRTRAGMGRCQGGFCSPYIIELLAAELGVDCTEVTKCGGGSYIATGKTKEVVDYDKH